MQTVIQRVLAAQNNIIYLSSGDMTTFTELSGAVVNTSDNITMCGAFQKVFVANGSIKLVIDFLNNKLVGSTPFVTPPAKGDILTQATSNARAIVDYVPNSTTVYATKITTEDFTTGYAITSDNAHGVTMNPASWTPNTSVTKPTTPHYSTWATHFGNTVPLPNRFYLVCRYNGRLVISGNPERTGGWYMTRQANPFDLDFTDNTDLQSPIASDNADYGDIGDIVKALVPWHDDYLIFGCQNSMHYIQGDPLAGGARLVISDKVGMYGDSSWCFDGEGNLWFYGTGGLYKMSVQQGISPPVCMSNDIISNLVTTINADPHTHKISMGYDTNRNGIKLVSVELSTGVNKGYWIQINPFGVWPESVDEEISSYSMVSYDDTNPDNSALLIGCQDGFIRKEDDSFVDDEGTSTDITINSELLLPIIPAGKDGDSKGRITSTTIVTSGTGAGGTVADTDSVTASFYKSDTVEAVKQQVVDGDTPVFTEVLTGPGRLKKIRKKIAGRAIGIKLSNSNAGESWSYESAEITNKPAGGV
jgi:hypothetical protein